MAIVVVVPASDSSNGSPPIDGHRIAEELRRLQKHQVLCLPGLGWLQAKTYSGYQGRDPRTGTAIAVPDKRTAFFIADPDLQVKLEGGESEHREFKDELERFLLCLHPDGDFDGEDTFSVLRFEFADSVAELVHSRVLAGTSAEVAGLGSFSLKIRAGGATIKFIAAPELTTALNQS